MSKQLLSSLDSIESKAGELHSLLSNRKSKSRSAVIKQLEQLSSTIESGLLISKKTRKKPRSLSRDLKFIFNSVNALHNGIEYEDLTFTETRNIFYTKVMNRVRTLSESSENFKSKIEAEEQVKSKSSKIWQETLEENKDSLGEKDYQKALSVALQATEKTKSEMEETELLLDQEIKHKSTKKLESYAKYQKQLLSKNDEAYKQMRMRGTTFPTTCPLFVSFTKSRLREKSVLKELGFNFTFISSRDSDVADVALILEDQVLLQFSKKAALKFFENKVDSMRKDINKCSENILLRSKRKELKQAILKHEKLDTNLAKQKKEKSKAMIQSSLLKLESDIKSLNQDIKKLELTIKDKKHKVTLFNREIFKKSTLVDENGKNKVLLKPKAYEKYIGYVLGEFHNKGHHYSLLSGDFESHPTVADIQIAWLVPSSVTDVVRSLYGDQTIVASWGLPWRSHNG